MNSPVAGSIEYQLKEKINELQQHILQKHPRLPNLLEEIHKTLQQYPEQVTLLPEESIQIIVNGLEIQTGTELAKSISKSSSTSMRQKLKNLSAADL